MTVRALRSSLKLRPSPLRLARSFSSTSSSCNSVSVSSNIEPAKLSARWLSDTKARLGKCIHFGMTDELCSQAGRLLAEVARDWKQLVAGSEGFLTDPRRAGLTGQPIVWGEQDTMGHINNVMYIRYAESGRTNWTRQMGQFFDTAHRRQWNELLTSKSVGLILKRIEVDFKFPMTWPDRISVMHKLRKMPGPRDSSMLLDVMVLSEGKQRAAARCLEDVVIYDYRKGQKTECPDWMLRQFEAQFEEQETVKKETGLKIQRILDMTRWLEQQTWDRSDAKEDIGG